MFLTDNQHNRNKYISTSITLIRTTLTTLEQVSCFSWNTYILKLKTHLLIDLMTDHEISEVMKWIVVEHATSFLVLAAHNYYLPSYNLISFHKSYQLF